MPINSHTDRVGAESRDPERERLIREKILEVQARVNSEVEVTELEVLTQYIGGMLAEMVLLKRELERLQEAVPLGAPPRPTNTTEDA